MGNSQSSNSKTAQTEFKNFYDVVDYVATYYILTMDFKSLSKLSEKAYCDKLVILTSDIIERYFNDMEVTFLAQKIQNGVEVNKLTTENVRIINKDNLDGLDISNSAQKSIKKKRVCIGIAKYYVKIAHIFAAIVTTINPVYTYKDPNGETVKTGLLEKDKIPKNVQRKLFKLNICDNRIRALKKGEFVDEVTGNVTIQPKVCDMNVNKDGTVKDLADEPGIPELMNLYLDDNYDYSNGTFTGMSDNTKAQFMKDLNVFYQAFTENADMPPEITKFSDIKLRDYRSKPGCQGSPPVFKLKYSLNKEDKLFVAYAENIKKMIQSAADNQYKLLSVINDLFTYIIDPYSGKKVIRINPKLNDQLLQNCVVKTRRFIIDLYVKCETDYVNGMKIYEAIVESKILDTTQKQIDSLKTHAKKIINENKITAVPVKPTSIIVPIKPVPLVFKPTTPTNNSPYVIQIKPVPVVLKPSPPSTISVTGQQNLHTPLPEPLPTNLPAPLPSALPTAAPMPLPEPLPTNLPEPLPTNLPEPFPTNLPTNLPTPLPTNLPSPLPTNLPTPLPTNLPTPLPTNLPAPSGKFFPGNVPTEPIRVA